MRLPTAFRERYAPIAPPGFFEALAGGFQKTLRVNRLKTDPAAFRQRVEGRGWRLESLPWSDEAFTVDRADRSVPLGHSLEHFAGHCYVQEASSQVPPLVLGAQPGERVLDLAAAPGSKTTQLAAMMANRGLLVANDSSIPRLKALAANLERTGVVNTVVTQLSGPRLGRLLPSYFDRVLLDAPCTAEGTAPKNREAFSRWSVAGIRKLAALQGRMIAGAYHALRPGGTLVYSTCTFAPEENELVVAELLANHPDAELEPAGLPGLPAAEGLIEWDGRELDPRLSRTRRIWPGVSGLEGFFIAKIRKGRKTTAGGREFTDRRYDPAEDDPGGWLADRFGWRGDRETGLVWLAKETERWLATPAVAGFRHLPAIRRGLRAARTVRGGFKPTTDLLQLLGNRVTRASLDCDAAETERYLAGHDLPRPTETGYLALRHDGLTFACGLGQGDRVKNQLPVSRRILH